MIDALPPAELAAPALAVAPAAADAEVLTLDARQLIVKIERLLEVKEYALAETLAKALEQDKAHKLEAQFLQGMAAVESGRVKEAVSRFRAALSQQPDATRVRLELARALMLQGHDGASAYHFRLASRAGDLPPEVRATVNSSLALLRERKPYSVATEFALVPDSNVTGGTQASSVDINLGGGTLPFQLQGNVKAKPGLGQSARVAASYRLGSGKLSWLADVETSLLNQKGKSLDDFGTQIALGPRLKLTDATDASLQATLGNRWYGGDPATRQLGVRASVQHARDRGDRLGLSLDARQTTSFVNRDYSGWNLSAYATYERVVGKSFVASASVFARSDRLREKALSSNEAGLALGVGGEFPWGINAGLSANVSRAGYAAPVLAFGSEARRDWRASGRAYVGLRNVRLLGFSPSLTYTYARNASSYKLYDSKRSRLAFTVARYF